MKEKTELKEICIKCKNEKIKGVCEYCETFESENSIYIEWDKSDFNEEELAYYYKLGDK